MLIDCLSIFVENEKSTYFFKLPTSRKRKRIILFLFLSDVHALGNIFEKILEI